ncbi:MAG: 2-phosphosulfolactate phosphatase [Gemmatimonadaceae bacterium]
MRIDVYFGVQGLQPGSVQGRLAAVIDVLRASSVVAVALANGARAVVPLESSDEVIMRSKSFDRAEVRLAGERKMHPIPGFDFGNSPTEFTRETVEGKTVLFTTTNGTGAFLAVQGARDVVVASYVNFTAVLTMMRAAARAGTDISIICAGREREFALEDAGCAGRYVRQLVTRSPDVEMNDGARASELIAKRFGDRIDQLFAESAHGHALGESGYAEDLVMCAQVDSHPIIPIYQDRQITKLGPERER